MTDLDLLTGAIAARLRLLPDVARLYPSRTGLDAVDRSASGLLDAVAVDPAVTVHQQHDGLLIETSVGLIGTAPAPDSGTAISHAIRDACRTVEPGPLRVRVRISTID